MAISRLLPMNPAAQYLLQKLQTARLWQALAAGYLLLKIPVPLLPEAFPILGLFSTLFLGLAALTWAWERVGWRAVGLALLAGGLGWLAERIGLETGLPFGQYLYTAPAPLLAGVPWLVVLGWFAMPLAALALSGGRAWLGGLMLVAWDLGLEPLMVFQGYWQWNDPAGIWYGAPLLNFVGWWLVGSLIVGLMGRLAPGLARDPSLGVLYRLEALFLPAGLVLMLGDWTAALVCGVAMHSLARWPLRLMRLLPHLR